MRNGSQKKSELRVLHLEAYNYSAAKLQLLEREFYFCQENLKDQTSLLLHLSENQYDVIFTRLGLNLDAEALSTQSRLKYIVSPTTGLNHIDLDFAVANNIRVISLKGEVEFLAGIKSTAEHTWALLLALIRKLPGAVTQVKNDVWERHNLMATELDGKTIGIIGFGRLGKIIARYADAFGMRILVNDVRDVTSEVSGDYTIVSIDNLLHESDVVCLMISYNNHNIDFIDESKIREMKTNAVFINTSRGEMVNETALVRALETNKIAGAAIDVLKNDSTWSGTLRDPPLLIEYAKSHDNLIITPHMGGYGKTSILKTRDFVTDKLLLQIEL